MRFRVQCFGLGFLTMFLLSLLRKGDFRATSSTAFECAFGSHLWFVGCVYRFKLYSTRRANTHLHAFQYEYI